jgi:hypothetical protein
MFFYLISSDYNKLNQGKCLNWIVRLKVVVLELANSKVQDYKDDELNKGANFTDGCLATISRI